MSWTTVIFVKTYRRTTIKITFVLLTRRPLSFPRSKRVANDIEDTTFNS